MLPFHPIPSSFPVFHSPSTPSNIFPTKYLIINPFKYALIVFSLPSTTVFEPMSLLAKHDPNAVNADLEDEDEEFDADDFTGPLGLKMEDELEPELRKRFKVPTLVHHNIYDRER